MALLPVWPLLPMAITDLPIFREFENLIVVREMRGVVTGAVSLSHYPHEALVIVGRKGGHSQLSRPKRFR